MNRFKRMLARLLRWLWQSFWRASRKTQALVVVLMMFVVYPAGAISIAMMFVAFGAILYMLRALTQNILPKKKG